jgi:hypothetical protein
MAIDISLSKPSETNTADETASTIPIPPGAAGINDAKLLLTRKKIAC